jgi:hypothetical protein
VGLATLILRRWPGLIKKTSQNLSIGRIMVVNRDHIDDYFNIFLDALTEKSLLDKPGYICNLDESDFHMNPGSHTVIAEKGSPTLIGSGKWLTNGFFAIQLH